MLDDHHRPATAPVTPAIVVAPADGKSAKKAALREKLIDRCAQYIAEHCGPDSKGRGHPTVSRLRLDAVEAAIARARTITPDLPSNLEAHHFRDVQGIYNDSHHATRIVEKQVRHLLDNQFGGSIGRMIEGITWGMLTAPLKERVGNREVTISMFRSVRYFDDCPSNVVITVLKRWAGQDKAFLEWAEKVRPYHFRSAPQRTYTTTSEDAGKQAAVIKNRVDVLGNKIRLLLTKPKYGGNLGEFIRGVTWEELRQPYQETICGYTFTISSSTALGAFGHRRADALIAVIKAWSETDPQYLELATRLQPYHFAKVTAGTFTPMTETAEEGAKVRASAIELLCVRVKQLLGPSPSNETIGSFVMNLRAKTLLASFSEEIDDHIFPVSPVRAMAYFRNSPSDAISAVFQRLAVDDPIFVEWAAHLRPHHFVMNRLNTFTPSSDEPAEIARAKETALSAVVDRFGVLLEVDYKGDFDKACRNVRFDDLRSSYQDTVAGVTFEISVVGATNALASSCTVHAILSTYAKRHGLPFNLSPLCFTGCAVTREQRISGSLSRYDWRKIQNGPGKYDTSIFGFRQFDAPDKEIVRELAFDRAVSFLCGAPAVYLGLETEQFSSLRKLTELTDIDTGIVVERDTRVHAAMESARTSAPPELRRLLQPIQILSGDFNEVVSGLSVPATCRFNTVNYDTMGRLSKGKLEVIDNLFANDLLADRAMLIVTISESPIELARARREGITDDFYDLLTATIIKSAGTKYELCDRAEARYGGGTNGTVGTPMRTCMFSIARLSERNETPLAS